jgi:hypothetical protein
MVALSNARDEARCRAKLFLLVTHCVFDEMPQSEKHDVCGKERWSAGGGAL